MPYRHFQVPCSGGQIEEDLNQFIRSHRVLKTDKHFVPAAADSFWAYHIHYEDTPAPVRTSASALGIPDVSKKGMIDYKTLLNEADFNLFLKLKDWRKERAQQDGVEAFTIFTNAQLAELARQRCTSLEAMKTIAGVGDGRVEKYGHLVLALLQQK